MIDHMKQIAVLASGTGTNFENLVLSERRHGGSVQLLVHDRPCLAAQKAKDMGIDCFESKDSEDIFEKCRAYNIRLVCCAGWLRKLKIPPDFSSSQVMVMNIHPSLLPAFGGKGMYGMNVHEAVYKSGCRVSGCTVHFVDNEYDHGPIIMQRTVDLSACSSPAWIAQQVAVEEKFAYPTAVKLFLDGLLEIRDGRVFRLTDDAELFYDQ